MVAKGDLLHVSAADAAILEKGECGGAITALLKYALESGTVDAVVAVKKGYDLYESRPAVITDPEEIAETAGSLHCGTLLIPKLIKKFLNGARDKKIAVTMKGCDAKAMYELAKRQQINLDNVYTIGLNCGGSISPISARKMVEQKLGINPDDVVKEEIVKGQCVFITKDGKENSVSCEKMEEEGFGRRANCQRCKTKIPRQCDIACGNWGVPDDKAGKVTFIEVCSEKGAELLNGASSKGAIKSDKAGAADIEGREKKEKAMLALADKRREEQFAALGEGRDRLEFIMAETSRCIKCYQCIENCPICYCVECSTKKPHLVTPGQLPPPFMFHLIRYTHIADSCINCGQCEELCAMDIPNALYMHAIQLELQEMFGYEPGVNLDLPVLALVEEPAERQRLNDTGDDQIFNIFEKEE